MRSYDAGEIGAGHTVTALYEVVPVGVKIDIPDVDPLKYQAPERPAGKPSEEMLTVKLRYKEPDGDASKPLEVPVTDPGTQFDKASVDFRFAASVAGFGMILRDSKYKGGITLAAVKELAQGAIGPDLQGHRAEFLRLVEQAEKVK